MGYALFNINNKSFIGWSRHSELIAKTGEVLVIVKNPPNPRRDRYNDSGGIRRATSQEIVDYDIQEKDRSNSDNLNNANQLSVILGFMDVLNTKLASNNQIIIQELKEAIKARRRQLDD